MNKKFITGFVLVLVAAIFVVVKMYIIDNSNPLKQNKYTLNANETILEEFTYNKNKYLITGYYEDDSSYANINILLEDDKNYYLLKEINNCDISYLIDNNNIYYHCVGKKGDVTKVTINRDNIFSQTYEFDYKDTPNISEIHINIDSVDKNNIILKSNVKKDDHIKAGEYVSCSFKTKKCSYIEVTNRELTFKAKDRYAKDNRATFEIKNNGKTGYGYGQEYRVEVYKNGSWTLLEPKENLVWNDILYTLKENESKEFTIDFTYGYGKLEKGTYRLVKNFLRENEVQNRFVGLKDDYYAEFEVK